MCLYIPFWYLTLIIKVKHFNEVGHIMAAIVLLRNNWYKSLNIAFRHSILMAKFIYQGQTIQWSRSHHGGHCPTYIRSFFPYSQHFDTIYIPDYHDIWNILKTLVIFDHLIILFIEMFIAKTFLNTQIYIYLINCSK